MKKGILPIAMHIRSSTLFPCSVFGDAPLPSRLEVFDSSAAVDKGQA